MKRSPSFARLFVFLIFVLTACTAAATPPATPTDTPAPTPSPAPTLGDPRPGDDGIGDSYFPEMGNGGYDALHYDLDLDVDMQAESISGTATIQARATQDLSRFNLDFLGFDISEVLVNGEVAEYGREDGELVITPAAPIVNTTEFTVAITYAGRPGEGVPQDAAQFSVGMSFYEDGVYVAGEPSGSAGWYPVNEHPLDKATYSFRVTVSEPYVVAANGLLQEEIDNGDTVTFVWESSDPIASYLVTIGIADFDVETETGPDGLPIRNYFGADVPRSTRNDFAKTIDMLEYFIDTFGPYPFEAYGVVVHDLDFGFALETQTLSVFGNSFTPEYAVSHELAHQWYGDSVSLASWQDIWLNEGFATYASLLYAEHAYGSRALEQEVRGMYENMAPGVVLFQRDKFEFLDGIRKMPFEGRLSRQQVSEALEILFADVLSEEEIAAALESVPQDGMPAEEFPDLVSELEFGELRLPLARFYEFLRAVDLGELTGDRPTSYPPPGSPSPDQLFSRSVYQRGALTLHALRLEVGDEAFFDILRTYYQRFQNGNASTQDFIAVAEEVSGQELDDLFEAWLYDQTIPDMPELDLFYEDYAME